MKKKLLTIFIFVILFVLTCGQLTVEAKTIKVHDHTGGPSGGGGGVSTLTTLDSEHYIYIDESSNYGYVVYKLRNQEEIIGTCEVIIALDNSINNVACMKDSEYYDCGSLTLRTYQDSEGYEQYYVSEVNGDLVNIFIINDFVSIDLDE